MVRYIFFCWLAVCSATAQELTGTELLKRAIEYHDPNGNWSRFNGSFQVTMKSPNTSDRVSTIYLNVPASEFSLEVKKDNDLYRYDIKDNECNITLNGNNTISQKDRERLRLSCERGRMYKDYYTYLYGLPMKLKDPGTLIDPVVTTKTFKNKEYLVLKVNYEKEVGDDTWYFYFDPHTYAMEVYQFYHDESKNDGEYILLEGIEVINGIKMPKTRAWYYNKDDKYLGTDILEIAN